jgi:hypothetical protein
MSPIHRCLGPSKKNASFLFQSASLLLALAAAPPQPLTSQESQPPCSQEEAGQFDFWVGEWAVLTPVGDMAGENRIQKILNGCVLHEQYQTPTGYRGESWTVAFDGLYVRK